MKKSMLFKSILAGALALSTFNAQAGLFNLGKNLIRGVTQNPSFVAIKNNPSIAFAVASGTVGTIGAFVGAASNNKAIATTSGLLTGTAGYLATGKVVDKPAHRLLERAIATKWSHEKNLVEIDAKKEKIAQRFAHRADGLRRVHNVAANMKGAARLKYIPQRILNFGRITGTGLLSIVAPLAMGFASFAAPSIPFNIKLSNARQRPLYDELEEQNRNRVLTKKERLNQNIKEFLTHDIYS